MMRCCVAALLIALGLPAVLEAQSIYLRSSAEIEGPRVQLDQIARIEGAPQLQRQTLFDNLRSPRYLRSAELQAALAARGLGGARVFGDGVWIVPGVRSLDSGALQTMLEAAIRARPDGERLLSECRIAVAPQTAFRVPESGIELRLQLPARLSSIAAGRMILALDGLSADPHGGTRTIFRKQIPVQIFRRLPVAIAVRDLAIGERLQAQDYRIEQREFEALEDRYPVARLDGMRVMSPVRQGAMLTASSIQTQPSVRRGQSLELTYQADGLVLRLRGAALEEGEPGDQIRVRPLFPAARRADTVLRARIVSESSAEVDLAAEESHEASEQPATPGA
ncbi:MAG: flagellar basal body P-ring formation chaperone FlgA [Leptospirales bacterium]|nr:flagellar basal body P-ring formation chaperone FlgA [Leptospirales bacterium]